MSTKPIPDVIYHYCSIQSLIKIIETKSIILSNSRKMNDYHETVWINHLIDKKLASLDQNKYKSYISKLVETFNINNAIPYIACFSESGDVLSQWRAYSNDGFGVSIGFSTKELNIDYKLPSTGAVKSLTIGFHEVYYDYKFQENLVNTIIDKYINNIDKKEMDEELSIIETIYYLKMYSTVFKNPSFEEENEWRIIHLPSIGLDKENQPFLAANISDIYFRERNNDIISYFTYDLSKKFDNNLIPKIILGPKCKIEPYDFELFLGKNNIGGTEVIHSRASYR